MTGAPPSGFSNVELDRWRSLVADRDPLSDAERVAIAGAITGDAAGPDPDEVLGVYGGVVDLVALHAAATAELRRSTDRLLGRATPGRGSHEPRGTSVPFVIGIAGSVAVGKSTVARVLQALITRWPTRPTVQIVSTDSFLHPNAVLDPAGLTLQKGFPISYDTRALVEFLTALRSGEAEVTVPVYSHVIYDVVPDEVQVIRRPDVVILEGVNVLSVAGDEAERSTALVSDHLDLSIYVDADEHDIERWFVERFAALRAEDHPDERDFYRQFATLTDEESDVVARWTWSEINLVNLRTHIGPTRTRAHVILDKGPDHRIRRVLVRDR